MSSPRNLHPNTTVFVTCRCVHQSFRLVPKPVVRRIVDFCFGVVSSSYREETGMQFYEYEFPSTHYHLVANNGTGCITDFLQDLNALIARELNALRGTSGAFFDRDPGIQTVVGDGRVFRHCVYTLANAVAAGIVHKIAHWKGFNSLRMEYGKEYVVAKPRVGLWSKKVQHKHCKSSQDSGRADFADRSKLPDTAVLTLDRPPIMLELSDVELRAKIREALTEKEADIAEKRAGKPVLGMKAAHPDARSEDVDALLSSRSGSLPNSSELRTESQPRAGALPSATDPRYTKPHRDERDPKPPRCGAAVA